MSSERIALDTNMLLAIPRFKVDVLSGIIERFGRIKFVIPKKVLEELEKMAKEGVKKKSDVSIVIEAIEKNNVKVIETGARNADDALVEMAKQGFWIASNDRVLRKRIKEIGAKNIYLKRKKLIEIE
ncbi:MAG: hypothetical protein CL943_01445 [Candidatus Diapherotrites archaeon]|uniref:VapC9 PIN-like domain-containing protein n=1 Tax=Candidatus Iainarchaeum sp. TaxID=3101447 RepID=A0A2D6M0K6_9ARCH|nr:hypothetical protein [Candidatus Diapherotrites archaeon]